MTKIDKEKPMLVIFSPMCVYLSQMQNINYSKSDPQIVRHELKYRIRHLAFALASCRRQADQGRYFVFEHPSSAKTEQLRMTREMLKREGVMIAKFDMCMFGMKTINNNGREVYAKKRTAIMTNAAHIAREVTYAGQCKENMSMRLPSATGPRHARFIRPSSVGAPAGGIAIKFGRTIVKGSPRT